MNLPGSGWGAVAGCCEHIELSGSIKFRLLFLELMTKLILVESTGVESSRVIFSSLLLLPLSGLPALRGTQNADLWAFFFN